MGLKHQKREKNNKRKSLILHSVIQDKHAFCNIYTWQPQYDSGKKKTAVTGNKIWLRCGLENTWLQLTNCKLQVWNVRYTIIQNQPNSWGSLAKKVGC